MSIVEEYQHNSTIDYAGGKGFVHIVLNVKMPLQLSRF